jgi:UDP-N-acetylglucosamine--N-acetylmuramyl-(pentapeptide) pyrophosphoryl-undecaprenol N-acetylglucosamine transferase
VEERAGISSQVSPWLKCCANAEHEALLFISEKEIDTLAVEGRMEFRFEKLPTVACHHALLAGDSRLCQALQRKPVALPGFFASLIRTSSWNGRFHFDRNRSLPAGCAAFRPSFTSQMPSRKANRHTARFVRAVLLGFMECAAYFPKARTEFTGTPIRSTLRRIDRKEALEKLGLYPGIPTLLVMGGSQGASGINQALIKAMPSLQNIPLQVIHLSGSRDERLLEGNYRRENIPAHVAAFHHRMEEVYSAADFVIARAGAASLAELAAFALPAMLIPYPYATDDHQTRNAEIFVRANAAFLLPESELSGELLANKIRDLLSDPSVLRTMSKQTEALARRNAARLVVETMERYSQPNDAVAA